MRRHKNADHYPHGLSKRTLKMQHVGSYTCVGPTCVAVWVSGAEETGKANLFIMMKGTMLSFPIEVGIVNAVRSY